MSIDKTLRTLTVLGETIADELGKPKDDMSEVNLIAVSEDDYWAIENAINTLRGLKILNGIFKDEGGS